MNATVEFSMNDFPAQGPSLVDILVPRVVYSAVGIMGVFGNALVLVVIGFVKELRSITNLLIANQSLIDLVASITLLIFRIVPQMPVSDDQPLQAALICIFFDSKILFWSTIVASTFSLVLITFERYYAILYPLHYRKSVTFRRTILVAFVPWLLGIANHVYLIFSFKVEDGTCKSLFSSQDYAVVGVVSFLIQYILPLVSIIFAYIRICISLRTRVEDVPLPLGTRERAGSVLKTKDARSSLATDVTRTYPNTSFGASSDDGPSRNAVPRSIYGKNHKNQEQIIHALPSYRDRARKNIINTLLIVSITFFICWTPNQIIFLIFNLGGPVALEGSLYYCSVTMAFCNMCINPFIYTFKYRRFQKGFKKLFGRKWRGGVSCVFCHDCVNINRSPSQ